MLHHRIPGSQVPKEALLLVFFPHDAVSPSRARQSLGIRNRARDSRGHGGSACGDRPPPGIEWMQVRFELAKIRDGKTQFKFDNGADFLIIKCLVDQNTPRQIDITLGRTLFVPTKTENCPSGSAGENTQKLKG
jgi:hypothetical protein